jgi:hypothetical protein
MGWGGFKLMTVPLEFVLLPLTYPPFRPTGLSEAISPSTPIDPIDHGA